MIDSEEIREKEALKLNLERKKQEINNSVASQKQKNDLLAALELKYKKDIQAIDDKFAAQDLGRQKEIADAFWKLKELQLKKASDNQWMSADELKKKLEAVDGEYMMSYKAGLDIKVAAFDKANQDLQKFDAEHKGKLTKDEQEQQKRLKDAIVQANLERINYETEYQTQKDAIVKSFHDKEIDNDIALYEKELANLEGFSSDEKEVIDNSFKALADVKDKEVQLQKLIVEDKIQVLKLQRQKELENEELSGTEKQAIMNKYVQMEYDLKSKLIDDISKKEEEATKKKIELFAGYIDMVKGAQAGPCQGIG